MKNVTTKRAVIYANDSNIWDNELKDFHYIRPSVCADEMSFSMPLEDAENLLIIINNERTEKGLPLAYLNELSVATITVTIYDNGSGETFDERFLPEEEDKAIKIAEEIAEEKTSIGTYAYSNAAEVRVEDESGTIKTIYIKNYRN